MKIWKKALGAAVSAAMIASLTISSAFAVVAGDQTDWLDCSIAANLANCSTVADGISTISLEAESNTFGNSLYITTTGATVVSVGADFSLVGGIVTATDGSVTADSISGALITFRAPGAPGTATVTVYEIATATGIATLEGTYTLTFTATSGLDVSATNSKVKTRDNCTVTSGDFTSGNAVTSGAATPANQWRAYLCVLVMDGNGSGVVGATVSATITPVGALDGTVYGQTTSRVTDVNGVAVFDIYSSGLAGSAVIATSATINSKTTSFLPVSFNFTGSLASITLANANTVGALSATKDKAFTFIGKDASGNRVPVTGASLTATYSTGAPFTFGTDTDSTASVTGLLDATCGATAGTGTMTVKSGSITSNAVTFNCSGPADTYSVAFSAATVNPGGQATITVTVKDAGGRPAPDGLGVSIVVSSGAILATSGGVTADGAATWTYLAPFNTGVVTVLATASVATSSSPQSASTTVGTVVPVSTSGTMASRLGVVTSGPFTSTTKLPALNGYVTFFMAFGPSAAGSTVDVYVASKNSAGVWSSFTKLTSRIANSSGNVYFYWRSASAAWLSIQGHLGAVLTNSSQARWR